MDHVNSKCQYDWLVQDSGDLSVAREDFHSALGIGMLYSLTDLAFDDIDGRTGLTVPFMLPSNQVVSLADDARICTLTDNAESPVRTAEESGILHSPTFADSSATVTTDEIRPCKRKRNVLEWKQAKRKYCKNHGEAYTSSTGRSMPAKQLAGVSSCCTVKCFSQFSSQDCQGIFNGFWALGNHDAQTAFIGGCIEQKHTMAHKQTAQGLSKNYTRTYHVRVGNRDVTVCKAFFLEVLGISAGRVDRVLKGQRENGGVVTKDKRGRYVRLKDSRSHEEVLSHIRSFPVNNSHYTRAHSANRMYLSSDLSVNEMYDLYLEKCKEMGTVPVKPWYYRDVFNTEFNLAFHPPRKDSCKQCDIFKINIEAAATANDQARVSSLKTEHELHLRKVEAVRSVLRSEQVASADHEAFSFDLQKVMSFPQLTTNEVYYCRQLSVYNLGIHNLVTGQGIMNVWDEAVASRGAEDIGSCILKYCKEKAESGIKSITAFSDACGGQNRNYKLALIWMHLSQASNLEEINHIFMVSGHSYLPNDADFGIIERAIYRCKQLYVPEQFYNIIKQCNKKNPFKVVEMEQDMFVSVKELERGCTIRKTSLDGHKVQWLKIQWLQVRKSEPFKLYYKYSVLNDVPFSCVDFVKKGRKVPEVAFLKCAYSHMRTLSHDKSADIQKLLKYIPPINHEFYIQRMENEPVLDADDAHENTVMDGQEEKENFPPGSANRSGTTRLTRSLRLDLKAKLS